MPTLINYLFTYLFIKNFTSVPATFEVYPAIKWYIAYSGVNFEIGGKTPN